MNFRGDALEFVRRHGCANSCPLELIQEAMEYGAMHMAADTTFKLTLLLEDLRKKHEASKPHDHQHKPIAI